MAEHLLPPNATRLEKTVAASFAKIQTIPVPISSVRDPQTCPAHLLPWLAFHHAVDEWNAAWPEQVRRDVIAASYEIKKSKGTRFGVLRALQVQGFANVRYETWFEYGGSPYRFRLFLDIDPAQPWREADDARLIGTVLRAKAVRSRLDALIVTRPLPPPPLHIAAVLFLTEEIRFDADYSDVGEFPPPSLRQASGIIILETIRWSPAQ